MGKKGKKDKKGKGAEKTAQKTEKNLDKKQKKLLKEKGEEDIESLIAEFREKDRQKEEVSEEKCPPPSHRSNMSLTPHPDKEELIMFGGEYFNGQKTFLYNDLFFYNIKNNEWSLVKAPNAPPPRCSHQAVALRQGGGQLWIFGGEFASPTQSQFYHYKDLWVYHLREKKWDKISAPGGPSARSGHRMVVCKKMLIVFGGFHDNTRDYKYYNDLYAFNLESYTWTKLEASGNPPLPRSGHVMATTEDGQKIVIYGGYSKERVKKDVDKGKLHTDMFTLVPEGKSSDESCPTKWRWQSVKQTGVRPSPRCGCSLVATPGNRAVVFGGVFDEEEDDENVKGKFYNDMYSLELDKGKWHDVELRGKQDIKERKRRRKQKEKTTEEEGELSSGSEGSDIDGDMEEEISKKLKVDENQPDAEAMDGPLENIEPMAGPSENTEIVAGPCEEGSDDIADVPMKPAEENVFKVVVSGPSQNSVMVGASGDGQKIVDLFVPHPRMNPILAMRTGVLFLYGGLYEDGDKQFTLHDFYSLDLHKLDEWRTIVPSDLSSQEWLESDSSGDEGQAGGGQDSDEDMDVDAPPLEPNESCEDYFKRTVEFWLGQAQEMAKEEGVALSEKQMRKAAKNMAKEAYEEEQES